VFDILLRVWSLHGSHHQGVFTLVKVVLSKWSVVCTVPLIGGDFMHLLCVYSSACKVGFVGWTSTILLQDSVRQYFSACYAENVIPSKTGHSCALYDSKTCLLTAEGCHVVLCSFEWNGKLVEFFNTNLYVRINLLIAVYEAGRLWTYDVVVLAGVETRISTCYSYIGDCANCKRVMLSETRNLPLKNLA
jgi:hypothetical protein